MKIIGKILVICVLLIAFTGLSQAGKVRKLPTGAYIKAAKIEILSGDKARYETAIALLDSLFMHYGHHAEGLHLMASIYVDYTDQTPDPMNKLTHVEKMVAYFDSLKMCCENKEIKSKYKKDCKTYVEKSDSTRVKFWREFYNAGIDQLNYAQDLSKELETATDSITIEFATNSMNANIDSCVANMKLAIAVDPSAYDPYVATGNAYEYAKNFEKAIEWLSLGLDKVTSRDKLLLPIAYDHIRLNQYCEAIPFFREYIEIITEDISTMSNLASCYNNCNLFDSAVVIYHRILTVEPDNTDVLTGVGRYFNQIARNASDSSSSYQQQDDETAASAWRAKQQEAFDSSLVYLGKVFELKPDDEFAVEEYGVVSAIRGKYDQAAVAFERLTELTPDNPDNWTWLGDCYLNLKQFDKAIPPYERVVELDPSNKDIWSRLKDLYDEIGDNAKAANAGKMAGEG